jgi:hypothetical protein
VVPGIRGPRVRRLDDHVRNAVGVVGIIELETAQRRVRRKPEPHGEPVPAPIPRFQIAQPVPLTKGLRARRHETVRRRKRVTQDDVVERF